MGDSYLFRGPTEPERRGTCHEIGNCPPFCRPPFWLVLLGASWIIFFAAMVWPAVALVARCIAQAEPPAHGFTFSARQLGLLWRSVWLSGAATGLALLASLPGAYVIGRTRSLSRQPLLVALVMALLLCPPMVYAFGWERLLPAHFPPELRCIGVWALWAWPIPAMVVGAGFSRVGHGAHEAALLVTSPARAFARVVLPLLVRHVALAGLILFVLFFSDYGVPHACGLNVYATELLGWAASSSHAIDTAWPASLSGATTVVGLALILLLWRACADRDQSDVLLPARYGWSRKLTAILVGWFAVSWLLPIGSLVAGLASPQAPLEAFRVYHEDLAWSLGLAVLSGILAVGMGLGIAATPRLRTFGLIWTVLLGALPGALVGEALIAGYNLERLWWVYDGWPIVALSYVSRFGWIGVLTAMLALAGAPADVVAQARTDGASRAGVLRFVQIPAGLPALLCGVAVVAAMSVAEVATSSLVRVPSFNPIAHILIEKFHRFEDDMLISLSLWLTAASLPGAILLSLVAKRRGAH